MCVEEGLGKERGEEKEKKGGREDKVRRDLSFVRVDGS